MVVDRIKILLIFSSILIIGIPKANAQDNLLRKKVVLEAHDEPLGNVLLKISDLAQFTFSYDASILPAESKVSVNADDETVRSLLNKILPENIDYKANGNHLVLLRKSTESMPEKKDKYTISGHIYNSRSREPLSNAVVYEISGLVSSVSNADGTFMLSVPTDYQQLGLSFSKRAFVDTIVFVQPKDQELTVSLSPEKFLLPAEEMRNKEPDLPAPVESLPIVQKFVSPQLLVRTKNLDVTQRRLAQISFLPTIGTNLKMSGAVVNNVSVNVLMGYAYGVHGFEVGGLLNFTRHNAYGFQAAGLGNVVGKDARGVQIAGLFNQSRGSMRGFQAAGISNRLIDTLKGVQVSGISNILHGSMKGWQIAGINNITTSNVDGIQLSGLTNVALGDVRLIQIAGLVNHGKDVKGLQLAGLVNHAKNDIRGFQVAGLTNIGHNVDAVQFAGLANVSTGTITGLQVSGLFNYAKYTKSSQLGLFNYADSASGTPIGFLSLVRKGFHVVEFSTNELTIANLAFKTGVSRFYNIFSGGIANWSGRKRWMFGYGFGSEKALGQRTFLNFEYTANWVNETKDLQKDLSLLNKLNISFGYRRPSGFALSVGPTINVWLSEWTDPESGAYLTRLAPYTLIETTLGPTLVQAWIGGKLAVQW